MKRYAILLTSLLMLLGACERTAFDELLRRQEDLQSQLDEHAARLAALENAVLAINNDITSLSAIAKALQENISIVSYNTISAGYLLTMSDGTTITLTNGKDGKDGQNGNNGTDGKDGKDGINAPQISVKQDTDGIYYWTLDGEFIIHNGSKLRVTGKDGEDGQSGNNGTDGKDGITPQLRVDEANNQWMMSYDGGNSWLIVRDSKGIPVPATGPRGETGPGGSQGPAGPPGAEGTFDFAISEQNGFITITYQGSSYSFPVAQLKISSSSSATFFVTETGALFGTGSNVYGQLGNGDGTNRNIPYFIMSGVKDVSNSGALSIILKSDGTVWVAGYNYSGELGLGYPNGHAYTFTRITDNAKKIYAGRNVFVIKNDNSLHGTGPNEFGQLGLGDRQNRHSLTKIMDDVSDVVQTYAHTLILKTDGAVYGTGDNNNHQLGLPHEQTPEISGHGTFITTTPLKCIENVSAIAAGYSAFSIALKKDGTVWGTGSNSNGQLGTGDLADRSTWTKLTDNGRSVAAGTASTQVLKQDGTLWVAGSNYYGELGFESPQDQSSFVQVATSVKSIFSGSYSNSTWYIRQDNTIWATGSNTYGQLGLGNTVNVRSFTQVHLRQ
ncbi:PL29 family lyase N-terminal domain-containing protein [Sphingobacterium corticibacter]|uniref:Chromosome condensation regulator RCC1 n=1 Tax=Sphingobacterium corticibacter TaxID=2171749 RepID=A0A2T8HJ91_9SPHI|nr:PL29 family lyase N-terminal domain-containing protein [Sphingobacterium corticibacter]PVH25509.1 chromosome condensation regulator RCC1 [Sphingobacterium corticibacter]